MKSEYATVDEYLDSLPHEKRYTLTILRKIIQRSIQDVDETMDYGMPTYKLNKKICAFVVQKDYFSLYIFNEELLEKNKEQFENLNIGKSCIRFKKIEDLPLKVIENILSESTK